jgi:hypothetical protein
MTAAVQKIYEKMTPTQLAALSVSAIAQGDKESLARILAAVERRTYTGPHIDFEWTRDTLGLALVGLGLEWWRGMALRSVSSANVMAAANQENYEQVPDWSERSQTWSRHSAVVDAVLHTLCKESALDEPTIRQWLKMPPYDPVALDAEQQKQHDNHMQAWREAMPNT